MILVTASLIWLFVDVRQQLTVLRIDLDKGTVEPSDDRHQVLLSTTNSYFIVTIILLKIIQFQL